MEIVFLDFILSIFISIINLWWLTVPILVMGIYALVVRLSLRRY